MKARFSLEFLFFTEVKIGFSYGRNCGKFLQSQLRRQLHKSMAFQTIREFFEYVIEDPLFLSCRTKRRSSRTDRRTLGHSELDSESHPHFKRIRLRLVGRNDVKDKDSHQQVVGHDDIKVKDSTKKS